MKLTLVTNGAAQAIEILTSAPECRFRLNGDAERTAFAQVAEPGVWSVLLDGKSWDARVEERPGGGLFVVIDGYRFEIEVQDPRRWSRKSGAAGAQGVQRVAAPMPGKVVRVLVQIGDAVEPGQVLLVVEAMKMQNEIKASRAGKVLSLVVTEGATVAAGEILATIG